MEYKVIVISANSPLGSNFERAAEELGEIVNLHISQGWKPQGGVSYALGKGMANAWLTQALIRETKGLVEAALP